MFGVLTCTQMLMHEITHGGCTNVASESTWTESWLGEKNPLLHLEIEPASVLCLAFYLNTLPTQLGSDHSCSLTDSNTATLFPDWHSLYSSQLTPNKLCTGTYSGISTGKKLCVLPKWILISWQGNKLYTVQVYLFCSLTNHAHLKYVLVSWQKQTILHVFCFFDRHGDPKLTQ